MNFGQPKFLKHFSLKLFQTLALKSMKDIYVMLARFLTQLKKLYKNIKTNRVSLIKKKKKENSIYCR